MRHAVILIGGYNSLWPTYLKLARDVEDLAGLPAVGVPLMPWHWWIAHRASDATNILQKLQDTVSWARRRLQAERFVLIGHSAGGLIARLYLHDQPVWGHVYAGVEHVTAVITLGCPHCTHQKPGSPEEPGTNWFLVDAANCLVPGPAHAGRVDYHVVAGRCVQGREHGTYRERRASRIYRLMGAESGDVWGDGIVPLRCQHLDGVETKVLEGVSHSSMVGRDWYGGSRAIVRRWWPKVTGDAH